MALPQREKLMEAQFQAFKELGGEAHISEIDRKVTSILDLSDNDSREIHEGNRTKLAYELAWGRFYLRQVNLLEKLSRGRWSLTAEGFETDKIDAYSIVNNYRPKDSVETELANDLNDDILREETNTEVEKEVQEISIEIKDPFDPKLIDIKSKTMMLKALFERLNHGEVDLFTDFQRQGDLWDITKQSRLIESILIRFPLPAFYFDGSVDDKWLIVDGLQRVSALKNFVIDKNFKGQPFKLANLEFLKNVEGLSYDDLPRDLKRRIDETEITTYIISPGTPIQVKYNLFKRINTSGLFLEPQEIRHALNQGEPAKFVKELADLPEFKKATCYAIKTERMLDRDFVTRYVSFRLINYNEYEPDLDSFLNKGMSLIAAISPVQRNQIKVDFIKAMNACIRLFDKYAFRKRYHIEDTRKPINKALFETWSVTLSKLSEERINNLILDSDSVNLQFIQLMNNDYAFQNSISTSTSDKSRVIKRFSEIQNLVDNLC